MEGNCPAVYKYLGGTFSISRRCIGFVRSRPLSRLHRQWHTPCIWNVGDRDRGPLVHHWGFLGFLRDFGESGSEDVEVDLSEFRLR